MSHIPVLLDEVCSIFSSLQGIVLDCTLGFGGHSKALLTQNPNIHIIGIDRDMQSIAYAKQNLKAFDDRFCAYHQCFSNISSLLKTHKVVGILADLGISSFHLDNNERGFGFSSTYLDMRMDQTQLLHAKEIINRYPKDELERILAQGEVRGYKKLASLIVERRKTQHFQSAADFASFIATHCYHKGSIHPATLAFQALRIEVNNELNELKNLLKAAENQTHILAIISFHSLEDRIIKQTFKNFAQTCICPPHSVRCSCGNHHSQGKILTKKPITPSHEEIMSNPRSRSAKLRVFQFHQQGLL